MQCSVEYSILNWKFNSLKFCIWDWCNYKIKQQSKRWNSEPRCEKKQDKGKWQKKCVCVFSGIGSRIETGYDSTLQTISVLTWPNRNGTSWQEWRGKVSQIIATWLAKRLSNTSQEILHVHFSGILWNAASVMNILCFEQYGQFSRLLYLAPIFVGPMP